MRPVFETIALALKLAILSFAILTAAKSCAQFPTISEEVSDGYR